MMVSEKGSGGHGAVFTEVTRAQVSVPENDDFSDAVTTFCTRWITHPGALAEDKLARTTGAMDRENYILQRIKYRCWIA